MIAALDHAPRASRPCTWSHLVLPAAAAAATAARPRPSRTAAPLRPCPRSCSARSPAPPNHHRAGLPRCCSSCARAHDAARARRLPAPLLPRPPPPPHLLDPPLAACTPSPLPAPLAGRAWPHRGRGMAALFLPRRLRPLFAVPGGTPPVPPQAWTSSTPIASFPTTPSEAPSFSSVPPRATRAPSPLVACRDAATAPCLCSSPSCTTPPIRASSPLPDVVRRCLCWPPPRSLLPLARAPHARTATGRAPAPRSPRSTARLARPGHTPGRTSSSPLRLLLQRCDCCHGSSPSAVPQCRATPAPSPLVPSLLPAPPHHHRAGLPRCCSSRARAHDAARARRLPAPLLPRPPPPPHLLDPLLAACTPSPLPAPLAGRAWPHWGRAVAALFLPRRLRPLVEVAAGAPPVPHLAWASGLTGWRPRARTRFGLWAYGNGGPPTERV
nr:vegetative cell wall protein gp1-like [Aegilops tauschii subsp. strangulata]